VVGFQVLDEFSKMFLTGTDVQETIDGAGILRMLRLARIARLVRMVRLVPELKSMVYLISASMHAFIWTMALLLILIYCVAVYYTEVSAGIIRDNEVDELGKEELLRHFGSIGSSTLSLFMAITGGDDWRNFVDQFRKLSQSSFLLHSFLFCVYMAVAVLVMLNLVTGVFVEGAQRMIQEEKDAELVKTVRKLFNITDVDLSGEISFDEFEERLNQDDHNDLFNIIELQHAEAKSLFKLIDTDRSGTIDIAEFVQGCMRLRGPARSVDLSALKYAFDDITEAWGYKFQQLDDRIGIIQEAIIDVLTTVHTTRDLTVAGVGGRLSTLFANGLFMDERQKNEDGMWKSTADVAENEGGRQLA
jgi:hypothetical protein